MRDDFLLHSKTAETLYKSVRDLPVYDYHCHLSPQEIWEDKPFTDVTSLMLDHDHYKWRLMRSAGIREELITGHRSSVGISSQERFRAYAQALEGAAGNPLYHWTHMELSEFFGIGDALTADNADIIRERANAFLRDTGMSPRSVLEKERVRLVVTTDDPADELEYHKLLSGSGLTNLRMTPAFRPDRVLMLTKVGTPEGFRGYLNRLGEVCGAEIFNLSTLKEALERRMQSFCALDCRFADIGIPYFPSKPSGEGSAERAFLTAAGGGIPDDADFNAYLWDMYLFIGKLCHDMRVLLQLHTAVARNVNSRQFRRIGADSGIDCISDPISVRAFTELLDAMYSEKALPEMIVYTLDPGSIEPLAAAAGCFRGVRLGAAWWFNDHEAGIRETLEIAARQGSLSSFFGMLTDSRSFLSYVRHDYFRRIASDLVASWIDKGEFMGSGEDVLGKISCFNAMNYCTESRI
ncbi:MAG: glucuronate isomerase [Clostridia bacterium]|nr:glucuronate isomerase [Clostridia bacterium]